MSWDRSKQKYWIARTGKINWSVRSMDDSHIVCDFPANTYDKELIESVCFANNDAEVTNIINDITNTDSKYQPGVRVQHYDGITGTVVKNITRYTEVDIEWDVDAKKYMRYWGYTEDWLNENTVILADTDSSD